MLTFARGDRKEFPSAVFNGANIVADEFKISYDMTMQGGYDGVEIEYVSPRTNKKTYIRYRITDTGIVEQAALSPLKISLSGCRNEYQVRDRALLEVNRLVSSRMKMKMKMKMKTLADGEYVSPGEMIVIADTYDTNQQACYIVARSGNDFDTSEQINFAGDMYVRVTDSIGNSTDKIRAYPRTDTTFGLRPPCRTSHSISSTATTFNHHPDMSSQQPLKWRPCAGEYQTRNLTLTVRSH